MMKTGLIFLTTIFFTITACHNTNSKTPATAAIADTAKFYPLDQFFKSEIQDVDIRNQPIYRITTVNGKRDSVIINSKEFAALASVFLKRDLSQPGIKAQYKESAFNDLSTESITLNYSPVNTETEVKNIDILLSQQTNTVKRVFIRSQYMQGDTSVTEQCSWKAGKSFQVNRSLVSRDGHTTTELNYINWNDKP